MLGHSDLLKILDYDPAKGTFKWKLPGRKRRVGALAGSVRKGRRYISIDYTTYLASRLAWFYVHMEWPNPEVDHIDLDKMNYRISNLRIATRSQQQANTRCSRVNTSGYKGVTWNAGRHKWQAQIKVDGKMHYLGLFDQPEAAHAVYAAAATEHFGEFARL